MSELKKVLGYVERLEHCARQAAKNPSDTLWRLEADLARSNLVMCVARMEARAEGRNEDEAVHEAFQALRKPALTVLEGGA